MMPVIEYMFRSGFITVIALAVLWLGTAAICARSRRPWPLFRTLLPNALSGTCLLLAVAAALKDTGVVWIAGLMACALVAHGTDLWQRLSVRRTD